MRKWKSLAGLTVVILLSIAVVAQGTPDQGISGTEQHGPGMQHRHANPQEQLDRLSKQLKLTDDQKEKIKPILEEQAQQMESLRSDTSVAPQERRAKFQELHQNTMAQIRPILNEDQQKKFDKMMKNAEERRAHRHGGTGPGPEEKGPQ